MSASLSEAECLAWVERFEKDDTADVRGWFREMLLFGATPAEAAERFVDDLREVRAVPRPCIPVVHFRRMLELYATRRLAEISA